MQVLISSGFPRAALAAKSASAKTLLVKWGIPYEEIRVDQDQAGLREFSQVTNGSRTVPQITIDGKWIGGFTELTELHMEDELDDLMQ